MAPDAMRQGVFAQLLMSLEDSERALFNNALATILATEYALGFDFTVLPCVTRRDGMNGQ